MRVSLLVFAVLLSSIAISAQEPGPEQLFEKAQRAQQAGDYPTALQYYEEILKTHPEVVAARANLAAVLTSQGRFDDAVEQYQQALKQVPGNRDLRLNLGISYCKKLEYSAAAAIFDPLHREDSNDLRVALLLSDCYSHVGRDSDTVSLLAPFEAADPQNLAIEWSLGSALIRSGQAEEGLKRIEKVAKQVACADEKYWGKAKCWRSAWG
jgi:thioredoxin-like negative regulator of GroEL